MAGARNVECPLCGREAVLEWHDDATVSSEVDISGYDKLEVCYTAGTESDADGYIHAFNDRGTSDDVQDHFEPDHPDPDPHAWTPVRKKPAIVEAVGPFHHTDVVATLEGDFDVDDEYIAEHGGYYLIRGVQGEVYPCGADIFGQTFEWVEPSDGDLADVEAVECPQCDRMAFTAEDADRLEDAGEIGTSSLACMKDGELYIHPVT